MCRFVPEEISLDPSFEDNRPYDTERIETVAFIYNPKAGAIRRNPSIVEKIVPALAPFGKIEIRPTTAPNTAAQIARDAIAGGARRIVAFGGDGTINETANGVVGSDVPLVILPGGTANCMCVETGIGKRIDRAVQRVVNESEDARIAVGKMTPHTGAARHFLAMAGVGLDAIVASEVNLSVKAKVGKVAYWIAGFAMFGRSLPQCQAMIDGAASQRSFVLISRVRNYGGDLEIARHVGLTDDCFETVSFTGQNSLRYLPYLAGVAARFAHVLPGTAYSRATKVSCTQVGANRVPVQIDGEVVGELPAQFEIVPAALTLRIPRKYLERKPWTTSR